MFFHDTIINALMENGFSFSYEDQFFPVNKSESFGYHIFDINITEVPGMDLEYWYIPQKEIDGLKKLLKDIAKEAAVVNGNKDGYFIISYRVLDELNEDVIPPFQYIYDWFSDSFTESDYKYEDETERFMDRLLSFEARTIALRLKSLPFSSSVVKGELTGEDTCTFSIKAELTDGGKYDEKEIEEIIHTIPLDAVDEFRFEICIREDERHLRRSAFVYRFSTGIWESH